MSFPIDVGVQTNEEIYAKIQQLANNGCGRIELTDVSSDEDGNYEAHIIGYEA